MLSRNQWNGPAESLAHGFLAATAFFSAAAVLLVFAFMAILGLPVLTDGDLLRVLTGPWSPDHHYYGIGPMIIGSACISLLALVFTVPLSLGCAVFITVTAPKGVAATLRRLVQMMTGIPTVIYGFVGIFFLVPLVRKITAHGSGLSILSAALMLSVLVAPTMILFFADGISQVPRKYGLAVTALGGTPIQRLVYVLIPQAWPTMLAGLILGFGRAVGDTMIALMLAGNAVSHPESILDPVRTLTTHIALVIAADFDSPEFRSLFICGLTLYLITTVGVVAMRRIVANGKRTP
jgi:phosphate transport system permease protein